MGRGGEIGIHPGQGLTAPGVLGSPVPTLGAQGSVAQSLLIPPVAPPQGASVLRMLSSFLTENLFKKGLAVSTAPLGQPGWALISPSQPDVAPGGTGSALTVACLHSPTSIPLSTRTLSTRTCGITCRRWVTASPPRPFFLPKVPGGSTCLKECAQFPCFPAQPGHWEPRLLT